MDAVTFWRDRIKANRMSERSPLFQMVVVGVLSLSLGWGIRGNFGYA
jgi:hypothetical protein